MSKLNDLLVMAELRGVKVMFCALIETHPDLTALQHAFARHAERSEALLQGTEVEDASIGALQMCLERWAKDLKAAAQQRAQR